MRHSLLFVIFFFLSVNASFSQTFTDSNLPIIIINTEGGKEIPDDPRIQADMKILYRGAGQRNYLADQENIQFLNFEGRIEIETRGVSSQGRNKKQYGFSTLMTDNVSKNNVSLLGLPEEHDWILNGMVWDPAMIRDYLSFNLSRQLGQYASRTIYCELVINGAYKGLFLLDEKIKADANRVDVAELTAEENNAPEVTGGYITKADKAEEGAIVAWTENDQNGGSLFYQHVYPKPEYITSRQNEYIHGQFTALSTAAANNDVSITGGFPAIIDIPSFIDFMIINEIASNFDAYSYSTYFHKDRNGKLRAGPVWDSDQGYGNDIWGSSISVTSGWQFCSYEHDGSLFWLNLFNSPQFRCYFSKRWNELTQPGQPLNLTTLQTFIDNTVNEIREAASRNNAASFDNDQWVTDETFEEQITRIKSFITDRITWITANAGSFSECVDIPVPPLVITKIMFHPAETSISPDGKDPEFIEITNTGDETVDMTGIYFAGTGLAYQFPVNATIEPHASLILASDADMYSSIYSSAATGEFTRHLSNKSQNLVLADAFGNVIDNVSYWDSLPWPDADGNGKYLKLIDPELDNNVGSNWSAEDEYLSTGEKPGSNTLLLFPNPVKDFLAISSGSEILSVTILDLNGRKLEEAVVNDMTFNLDMRPFARGFYFVRIITRDQVFVRKIIKG